jgi:hypothetical protein
MRCCGGMQNSTVLRGVISSTIAHLPHLSYNSKSQRAFQGRCAVVALRGRPHKALLLAR